MPVKGETQRNLELKSSPAYEALVRGFWPD